MAVKQTVGLRAQTDPIRCLASAYAPAAPSGEKRALLVVYHRVTCFFLEGYSTVWALRTWF